jgi:hypothetical protein
MELIQTIIEKVIWFSALAFIIGLPILVITELLLRLPIIPRKYSLKIQRVLKSDDDE